MDGTQQFYGFAAVIIPVLLFGGAVVEQWRPQEDNVSPRLAGSVVFAMLLAIAAEVVAIGAAFTGKASPPEGALVVLTVVGGTVAAAGAVTWPWRKYLKSVYAWIVVATLVAAAVLAWNTYEAISAATPRPKLSAVEKAVLRISEAQEQSAARLSLIVSADSRELVTQRRILMYLESHSLDRSRIRWLHSRRFDRWRRK